MKRIMFFKIGGDKLHLPKLIGAFIIFAALFMFIRAGGQMFDSWDSLQNYPTCLSNVDSSDLQLAQSQYLDCKNSLEDITGIQLKGAQTTLTTRQFCSAFLFPIANLFAWAAVFLVGIIFYRTGTIVIPIEQTIRDVEERKEEKKR